MPPKRPLADTMTLHELGISEPDCGLDPDGLLDGPPDEGAEGVSSLEAVDDDEGDDHIVGAASQSRE